MFAHQFNVPRTLYRYDLERPREIRIELVLDSSHVVKWLLEHTHVHVYRHYYVWVSHGYVIFARHHVSLGTSCRRNLQLVSSDVALHDFFSPANCLTRFHEYEPLGPMPVWALTPYFVATVALAHQLPTWLVF